MRVFWVFMVFLLVVPSVFAVSMQIPDAISDQMTFWVNESTDVNFTIRGESTSQSVIFFVRLSSDNMTVEGIRYFEYPVTLSAYQTKIIQVRFRGVHEQSYYSDIEYGVKSSPGAGAVGLQKDMKASFEARVRCSGIYCPASIPSGSSSSGSGRSSGGGGVYIPSIVPVDQEDQTVENVVVPAVVQDVSGENVERVSVPVVPEAQTMNPVAAAIIEKAGKSVAVLLISIIIIAWMIQIYAIKVAKEVGQ